MVVNGRSAEKGAQAVAEMQASHDAGDRIHYIGGDVKTRAGCESIVNGLHFAHKHGLPVTSYHYTGANKSADAVCDVESQQVLDLQIQKFIELQGEQVLTDVEARRVVVAN